MAHLLAHVIDRGTRHVGDRAHAEQLLAAGATGLAADPMFDYTRFAVTVPAGALERVLWLESSRMGFAFERPDPGSATRLPSGLHPALMSILNDERGAHGPGAGPAAGGRADGGRRPPGAARPAVALRPRPRGRSRPGGGDPSRAAPGL